MTDPGCNWPGAHNHFHGYPPTPCSICSACPNHPLRGAWDEAVAAISRRCRDTQGDQDRLADEQGEES